MEEPTRNPLEYVFEAPVTPPGQRGISFLDNLKRLKRLLERYDVSPAVGPSPLLVDGRPYAHKVTFKSKRDLVKIKIPW